jgi:hypothetical protein
MFFSFFLFPLWCLILYPLNVQAVCLTRLILQPLILQERVAIYLCMTYHSYTTNFMVGNPFFAVTTIPPAPASLIDQVRPISIGNYTAIKSYDLPYGLKTNFSARTFDLNAKGGRLRRKD